MRIIRVLILLLGLCSSFSFDYAEFENSHFPFYIVIDLERAALPKIAPDAPALFTTFKFTTGDYFESIDELCTAGHYTAEGCREIMNIIRSHIFNPGGVVFDRFVHDYSSYIPVVLEAEKANNAFNCLEVSSSGSTTDSNVLGGAGPSSCLIEKSGSGQKLKIEPAGHAQELSKIRGLFERFSPADLVALRNVGFIHSCLPPGASTRVLEELLTQIEDSGLFETLDAMWVVHYGEPLPTTLTEPLARKWPGLHFVHFSTDIARFEVPTLRAVHYLSKLLGVLRGKANSDTNIMYLHTKGISYLAEPPQVRDWRALMTYFVVERHALCLGLLDAPDVRGHVNFTRLVPVHLEEQVARRRQYDRTHDHGVYQYRGASAPSPDSVSSAKDVPLRLDAVGVNLRRSTELDLNYPGEDPSLFYSGNFWWARASYLAPLPQLSIHRNNKYDAETWLGAGAGLLGSLHSSGVHHYDLTYPRERYAYQEYEPDGTPAGANTPVGAPPGAKKTGAITRFW